MSQNGAPSAGHTQVQLEGASELVLRPSLSRWGWIFGFATLLAVPGSVMVYRGDMWAWVFLGLAGLLTGFAFWVLLAPRMRLHLSSVGFAYGTVRQQYSFCWADVTGFGVSEFGSHRWVVFAFAAGYRGDERIRAINQGFGGFDRFLPDVYGLRAVELAELLEEWRLRHTRHFAKLLPTAHMLKWLADDPYASICSEVERVLQQQVPGSQLTDFRVSSEPQWLTGTQPGDDPSNAILVRTGVAFEFELVVREPTGPSRSLRGVLSWVGVHLDDSVNMKQQIWFVLDARLETHGSNGELLGRMYFA